MNRTAPELAEMHHIKLCYSKDRYCGHPRQSGIYNRLQGFPHFLMWGLREHQCFAVTGERTQVPLAHKRPRHRLAEKVALGGLISLPSMFQRVQVELLNVLLLEGRTHLPVIPKR